jgi:hypothetical protein
MMLVMRKIARLGWFVYLIPFLVGASARPDVESTYTVRVTMRIMKPVVVIENQYQTARVVKETDTYREVEYTIFPLVREEPVEGNANWRSVPAEMSAFVRPGITCNWDEAMRRDLIHSLKADGIDVEALDDKAVVEKVSAWLLKRNKYNDKMFDTWYVDFPNGKPRLLPGLEQAFEKGKGDSKWSVQDQFEHELLGREMYFNKTVGSCTSYAILQATVLKALGIPTRIVLLTPIVDSNDETQWEMVRKEIHHHRVRSALTIGLPPGGFSNHTINEVYVGKRWVRLNYRQIGQPALDAKCFGLTVQTHVVNDWSETGYAATWGKRYGLGERDEVTKTGNPYRAVELSDHFGTLAKIENPEVVEPKVATITKVYWKEHAEAPYLMVRVEKEAFGGDWRVLKNFLRQAPHDFELRGNGNDSVPVEATIGSTTDSCRGLFDAYFHVAKEQYAKLVDGVEYELVPPGDVGGFGWKMKGKIVVEKGK